VEPAVRLAFSVSRNKGAYALLLGSGVSRTAEIPTGWDVTLDLIRKVAQLRGQEVADTDLEAWYRAEYGADPDYSELLKEVAPTQAERNAVLRGYFVATPEQREQNIKVPTEAHRAIAELVASGYIRVIVTTNFDQLLEDALKDAGVDVNVVSTVDAIKGMLPIAHAACTVVKVHGDYRDARILNTVAELSKYRPAMNTLLDRIFDEYGLIVCGWSGESDRALCAALQRRSSLRYTTYWTVRDHVKDEAQRLIDHLKAETIQISGADSFFRNLSESVKAIEDTAQSHPLSARVAEATVKRYVVDERYRILLNDLVMREVTRVHDGVAGPTASPLPPRMSGQEVEQRLANHLGQTQTLMAMMVAGCYWGEKQHLRLWGKAMRRLSHFGMLTGGHYVDTHYLQLYPALLTLYSGSIAALGADRYDTLASLLLQEAWPDPEHKVSLLMAMHLNPTRVLSKKLATSLFGSQNLRTPTSDYLRSKSGIREATRGVWRDDDSFDDLFDWFEFFLGLVNWDLHEKSGGSPWAYRGGFVWRDNPSQSTASMKPVKQLNSELTAFGADWPPLRAGFFFSSLDRAIEVSKAYVRQLEAS
jgi:hypothetical protein